MQIEIPVSQLAVMVVNQITNLFYLDGPSESQLLRLGVVNALPECQYCFERTPNKYYRRDNSVYFNPVHSGQYCIFLYFLAKSVLALKPDARTLADRLYYLNKALNGLDLFYEVQMPRVFLLDHPVGSVLGRALYGEFFSFSQNCTVGNNHGIYPTLGRNVSMMSGAKIVGKCTVGDNVILAANSFVKDTDIEGCSLVFGSSPNLVIKKRDEGYFRREGTVNSEK